MTVSVSIDRNIINNLNPNMLQDKLLPALEKQKIIIHLTDCFFGELFFDQNSSRRMRHADICKKIFNGKIILPLGELIKSELEGNEKHFYDSATEIAFRNRLNDVAQGRPLEDSLVKELGEKAKKKKDRNDDFKKRQEKNLSDLGHNTKEHIRTGKISRERTKEIFKNCSFNEYFLKYPKDIKIKKIRSCLEEEKIAHTNPLEYLDNPRYPSINVWLRYWFVYHYYTVKRKQPTLKANDISDLDYIIAGNRVNYFVTDDTMLREVGNLCYDYPNPTNPESKSGSDKFIAWDTFVTNLLNVG